MQYLRDNAGKLESSADGTTWKEVFLNTGEPLKIGGLQLRDNAGIFEISDDNGATWGPVGSGIPSEIDSPVIMGETQLRDNSGYLEISHDNGSTWYSVFDEGCPSLNLQNVSVTPPRTAAASIPSMMNGTVRIWSDTATGLRWLLFKDTDSAVYKIPLGDSEGQPLFRITDGVVEVSTDDNQWYEVYRVDCTELSNSYFVAPRIEQILAPDGSEPALQNNGSLAVWRDTANSLVYLCTNVDDTIYKVEMT